MSSIRWTTLILFAVGCGPTAEEQYATALSILKHEKDRVVAARLALSSVESAAYLRATSILEKEALAEAEARGATQEQMQSRADSLSLKAIAIEKEILSLNSSWSAKRRAASDPIDIADITRAWVAQRKSLADEKNRLKAERDRLRRAARIALTSENVRDRISDNAIQSLAQRTVEGLPEFRAYREALEALETAELRASELRP